MTLSELNWLRSKPSSERHQLSLIVNRVYAKTHIMSVSFSSLARPQMSRLFLLTYSKDSLHSNPEARGTFSSEISLGFQLQGLIHARTHISL